MHLEAYYTVILSKFVKYFTIFNQERARVSLDGRLVKPFTMRINENIMNNCQTPYQKQWLSVKRITIKDKKTIEEAITENNNMRK